MESQKGGRAGSPKLGAKARVKRTRKKGAESPKLGARSLELEVGAKKARIMAAGALNEPGAMHGS